MKLNLSRSLMFAALVAAGAVSSAHATNLVEIAGTNVKFYYDADFWTGTASVTGNTISFALSEDYDLTAKVISKSGHKEITFDDGIEGALFVVANAGYNLAPSVSNSVVGGYSPAATGGYASSALNSVLLGGSGYSNGVVSGALADGNLYHWWESTGVNPVSSSTSATLSNSYKAARVDTDFSLEVLQTGSGTSNLTLSNISYGFSVSAVPEPETYAMMIAGLGLVGFAARRRKQAV